MSNYKNFGIAGVGSSVQLGKGGGVLSYSPSVSDGTATGVAPAFSLFDKTAQSLVRLQTGAPLHISDAATKLYVDNAVQGLNIKASVAVASAGANVALTGNAPLTIDGIQVTSGQRVLLKDQTDATQNGIYVVTVSGNSYTLARSADASNVGEDASKTNSLTGGSFAFVTAGSTNADTGWVLSSPEGTVNIGTDHITFTQFSSAGVAQAGSGLAKNGQVFSAVVDGKTIHVNNGALAVQGTTTSGQVLTSDGSGNAQWSTLNLSNIIGGSVVSTSNGGTGLSTYHAGDLIVGASGNALSTLPVGTNGQFLTTDGTNVKWTSLNLADVIGSSSVPVANGGTGITSYKSGDLLVGNSSGALSALGTGTAGQVLTTDGTNLKWGSANVTTLYDPNNEARLTVQNGTATNGSLSLYNGTSNDFTLTANNGRGAWSNPTGNSVVQGMVLKASSNNNTDTSIVLVPTGQTGAVVTSTAYTKNQMQYPQYMPQEALTTMGYVDQQVDGVIENAYRVYQVSLSSSNTTAVTDNGLGNYATSKYLDKIKVVVRTPLTGTINSSLTYTDGTAGTLFTMSDVDLQTAGTYVIDFPMTRFADFNMGNPQFSSDLTSNITGTGVNVDIYFCYYSVL